MIPKIIHYCWVGENPKPESVLYCIESWKKFCPDYEIREWNETNYDFSKNEYMKQAYEAKKWGFVPDYARLDIIYEYGGIYLDTDVEMVRNFDELLEHESFFGFEDTGEGSYFVACGLGFGAVKGNKLIKELRDYYNNVSFLNEDGTLNLTPAPRHNTPIFLDYGTVMDNTFQIIQKNVFYPSEYFCPKIFKTGKTKKTKNTFSIHHFSASWMDDLIRQEIAHNQKICGCFGDVLGHKILLLESIWKKYGFWGSIKKGFVKIYEIIYQFWPIVVALLKRLFSLRCDKNNIVLFDTSLETKNMGDYIIMENCLKQLRPVLNVDTAVHISTHKIPKNINECVGKYKILCGTNILSSRMGNYGLWKLPRNLKEYSNITLMGVGFDSYNTKSDLYTRLLLKTILSPKGYHSVRDSFSENALRGMGIDNVLNTGCPTMWELTPEVCSKIPAIKGKNVVCTITDYCRDPEMDKIMIEILLDEYENVFLWNQGKEDLTYLKELACEERVKIIPSSLYSYDEVLKQSDLDYVGTRLHAGIRAIAYGHRSIVIAIDNRARCIADDTGLRIVERSDISNELRNIIQSAFETKLTLPWENIIKWKSQFH